MEGILNLIAGYFGCGETPLHKPYIQLISRWVFLHFRYLKCLVNTHWGPFLLMLQGDKVGVVSPQKTWTTNGTWKCYPKVGISSKKKGECGYGMILLDLFLLGQWLNFKLFGITYLVGKIKFKLFFRAHWLSECYVLWIKTLKISGCD